jgi:acyl-CoA synthetase (AMP-forming)/AMP-acid ligase II
MTSVQLDIASVPGKTPLLTDGDHTITYGEFFDAAGSLRYTVGRDLVVIVTKNSAQRIFAYLICLFLDIPVLLVEEGIEASTLNDIIVRFNAKYVVGSDIAADSRAPSFLVAGETWLERETHTPSKIHNNLALMLATSGSTGNPKFVRLSREAVLSNAFSIASGLHITPDDRAITSLPFSYTYGLSVINSHFVSGATICVSAHAMVSAEFWRSVDELRVTSIAGVPTSYGMLRKMRWSPEKHSSLRYMTQAGGRLNDEDRKYFLDLLDAHGINFYVMYGQTEATARITITEPKDLREHISTAGRAIEGGRLSVLDPDESGVGRIVYSGPNVMMGYAESADNLALGDDMNGSLETGDLGYLNDGLLFLTGRTKRIVKIFGIRVSLDDVDLWLHEFGTGVSVQGNDCVVLFMEHLTIEPSELRTLLSQHLHVHPTGVKVVKLDALPLLSSGKIDFQTLTKMAVTQ